MSVFFKNLLGYLRISFNKKMAFIPYFSDIFKIATEYTHNQTFMQMPLTFTYRKEKVNYF